MKTRKKSEQQKLIDYFRGEGYSRFGWAGDEDGLTPAETAIRAMRQLDAVLGRAPRRIFHEYAPEAHIPRRR